VNKLMNKAILLGTILGIAIPAAMAADGKALYETHCAKCHGADGKGQTKMGQKMSIKDYTLAATWAKLTDEKALKAVKEGLKDGDKTLMKAFEVTDEEAKAMVAYLKAFKK
jgi:mono/diheme cytochrome c family protein